MAELFSQIGTASPTIRGVRVDRLTPGDAMAALSDLPAGWVDLAFADPPFNIGYAYDVYHDQQADADYLAWSERWLRAVHRALKEDGTLWIAIGDEYAAELKWIATRQVGFHLRSWVVWYYTFGVNCKFNFSRSHTHLLYLVKDPSRYTFDDTAERVPSARQLVYADARANPRGRLPDNTWILRPHDANGGFRPDHDVWYFPRVAGTFKERAGFHGCQMPEQLLGRIIRVCSRAGEVVLDPFAGSGSTLVVAKKLGRHWCGYELSAEYAARAAERLAATSVGQPLQGPADPLNSAPATAAGKRRLGRSAWLIRERVEPGEGDAATPSPSATPGVNLGVVPSGLDDNHALTAGLDFANDPRRDAVFG